MTGRGSSSFAVVGAHRALVVEADRDCLPNALAKNDDGGFCARAMQFGIGIIWSRKFVVLVLIKGAGPPLFGGTPRGFDLHQLRPCGNPAVDVRRHLGLKASAIETFVESGQIASLSCCLLADAQTARGHLLAISC
jgi:hypothetical protein